MRWDETWVVLGTMPVSTAYLLAVLSHRIQNAENAYCQKCLQTQGDSGRSRAEKEKRLESRRRGREDEHTALPSGGVAEAICSVDGFGGQHARLQGGWLSSGLPRKSLRKVT